MQRRSWGAVAIPGTAGTTLIHEGPAGSGIPLGKYSVDRFPPVVHDPLVVCVIEMHDPAGRIREHQAAPVVVHMEDDPRGRCDEIHRLPDRRLTALLVVRDAGEQFLQRIPARVTGTTVCRKGASSSPSGSAAGATSRCSAFAMTTGPSSS